MLPLTIAVISLVCCLLSDLDLDKLGFKSPIRQFGSYLRDTLPASDHKHILALERTIERINDRSTYQYENIKPLNQELGHGTSGKVSLYVERTGRAQLKFAVKSITMFLEIQELANELEVMRKIGGIEWIPMIYSIGIERVNDKDDADQFRYTLHIVMEYIDGINYMTFIKMLNSNNRIPIPVSSIQSHARDIIRVVSAIHSRGVIHRDIKLDNFMLDKHSGRLRLLDFGTAAEFNLRDDVMYEPKGTYEYMAPEMMESFMASSGGIVDRSRCSGYTKDVDWWSVAVSLYELATGELPFPMTESFLGKYYLRLKSSNWSHKWTGEDGVSKEWRDKLMARFSSDFDITWFMTYMQKVSEILRLDTDRPRSVAQLAAFLNLNLKQSKL